MAGLALSLVVPGFAWAATLSTGIDGKAHLPFWELKDRGMSLRLVQRLPDQTRGFFMARGFSGDQAEQIAQSCVFQTVFKNLSQTTSSSPLAYDLRDWRVWQAGVARPMKTREDWAVHWSAEEVATASRIALEWALYPTAQEYRPGDYNWGMSTFNLPPGTRFDLEVVWHQYGEIHRARIEGLECAADVQLDPAEPAL
jgi:hypothetical protein